MTAEAWIAVSVFGYRVFGAWFLDRLSYTWLTWWECELAAWTWPYGVAHEAFRRLREARPGIHYSSVTVTERQRKRPADDHR